MDCQDTLMEFQNLQIRATLPRVSGAFHWVHWEQPEIVSSALRDLWEQSRY
jgi:pimeloyl-ACP methyl ester carboxylesterase